MSELWPFVTDVPYFIIQSRKRQYFLFFADFKLNF